MEATQNLKQARMATVVTASLSDVLPEATQLVWSEFCSDCPKKDNCLRECYMCHSAVVMTRCYVAALVEQKAKWN